MNRIWLTLPLATALAACGGGEEGTSISINGSDGEVSAKSDADGRVSLKAPGFEGSIKLPKFNIGADDFEVDGVKLYPGSTISNFNIDADSGTTEKGGNAVRVQFDSPASAAQVGDWFAEQMKAAGFTVEGTGPKITGMTRKGSAFTVDLSDAGDKKSSGTLTVQGE